jgi:hypothetical protein
MNHRFKIGDKIKHQRFPDVVREITALRPDGYEWRYPEIPGKKFLSADSPDPEFHYWQLIEGS